MGMGDDLMAKMTIKGLDEYALALSKLGTESTEISKKIVYEGAKVVADEIKAGLKSNLASSKYSTGDLIKSLGIAPIDIDRQGNTNTKVGFDGYDSKGVPNQLKARVMESGTSNQKKKPFVRPAVNRSKNKALEAMKKVLERELLKLDK